MSLCDVTRLNSLFFLNNKTIIKISSKKSYLNAFDVLQLPKTHIDLFLGVSVCSSNKPAIVDEGGMQVLA